MAIDQDPSDDQLLVRSREGDRAALSTLATRHHASIYRLARSLTSTIAEAEDVVQETLLALVRSSHTYRGDAPVRSWLFTIARNAACRLGRRSSQVPTDDDELAALGVAAGWGTADVRDVMMQVEQHNALEAALAALSVSDREIIALRDIEGMDGQETADMLGIPLDAMKSRLHRARLRLAAALRVMAKEDRDGHS